MLTEQDKELLAKFSTDLTNFATMGLLDPVVGREEEIDQIIETLSRRRKNNPLIIGEAGVGKTAIVEGLAQRIAADEVPYALKDKSIITIDLSMIVSKAQRPGEFEELIKLIIVAIIHSEGMIIPFVDEVHMLMGAKGTLNASDILKPPLARGELHMIGATTYDEYTKYIEKDPALERRFQVLLLDEPNVKMSQEILKYLRIKYEVSHGVRVSDAALMSAAVLSDRYIQNRNLPDKAIDLIDIACARKGIDISTKIRDVEVLNKIDDSDRGLFKAQKNAWDFCKSSRATFSSASNDLVKAKREKNQVEIERLTALLPSLESKMEESDKAYSTLTLHKTIINDMVSDDDVASVIQRWTGIPVSKLLASEKELIMGLEPNLKKHIYGQDPAVRAISDFVKISRSGLESMDRPRSVFLFVGAVGAGKSSLPRHLAKILFNDDASFIPINMNEYQEPDSLKELFGSAGSDGIGLLLSSVKKKPYSVILFDEIEKAHPSILDTILQILDIGMMRDNKGRKINFRNTYICMTSNLELNFNQRSDTIAARDLLYRKLLGKFRAEFINKIDEIVFFETLSVDDLQHIAEIKITELQESLVKQDLQMSTTKYVFEFLGKLAYNPEYGARELDRVIKDAIKTRIADGIISNKIRPKDKLIVDVDEEGRKLEISEKINFMKSDLMQKHLKFSLVRKE